MINAPGENYCSEALEQGGAGGVGGQGAGNRHAVAGRQRDVLGVRGVAGSEARDSIAGAEAAVGGGRHDYAGSFSTCVWFTEWRQAGRLQVATGKSWLRG